MVTQAKEPGYRAVRKTDKYQSTLKRLIQPELVEVEKTFEDEFFMQLYRLKGFGEFDTSDATAEIVAFMVVDLIFKRLPPDVIQEMIASTSGENDDRCQ